MRGVGLTWDENGDAHIRVNVDSNFREKICGLIPSDFDGVAVELRSVRDLKTFTKRVTHRPKTVSGSLNILA